LSKQFCLQGLILASTKKLDNHFAGLPLSPEPASKKCKLEGANQRSTSSSSSYLASPEPYRGAQK